MAGAFTALVALLALVGVKLQIDATAQVQATQSARDIYRGFLELSIAQPDLAHPAECRGTGDDPDPAYHAYLDYLLYTTEQVTALDPVWDGVMDGWLENHIDALCVYTDLSGFTPEMLVLLGDLRTEQCTPTPDC